MLSSVILQVIFVKQYSKLAFLHKHMEMISVVKLFGVYAVAPKMQFSCFLLFI